MFPLKIATFYYLYYVFIKLLIIGNCWDRKCHYHIDLWSEILFPMALAIALLLFIWLILTSLLSAYFGLFQFILSYRILLNQQKSAGLSRLHAWTKVPVIITGFELSDVKHKSYWDLYPLAHSFALVSLVLQPLTHKNDLSCSSRSINIYMWTGKPINK